MGTGDGEGGHDEEGNTGDFQHSETMQCTLTGDTCLYACPTHRSTKNPEANYRLSNNDVPMYIQIAINAPHPGRLLQWRTLCMCGDRRCMETLYSQFNADSNLKLL